MRITLPTLALLALAGCAPTIDNHGHRLDPDVVSSIQPGTTSKQDVAQRLGSPSTLATFEDDRWYYVAQRTERKSFYQEKITAQQVLAITFGPDGMVSSVDHADLAEAENITPNSEITPTAGNELTLAQQLLGNIGRFNNTDSPTQDRAPPFWSQSRGNGRR